MQPPWSDVKDKLAAFGGRRCWTCCTISTPHKDNEAFLHAGFGSSKDVLGRTRKPSLAGAGPFRVQDVSKAKRAISHYKKSVGEPAEPTELMVSASSQWLDAVRISAIKRRSLDRLAVTRNKL